MTDGSYDPDVDIAVIGMAGRFPQATDVAAFWRACAAGTPCLSSWDGPRRGEGHVLAGGLVADQDLFDAEAFGVTPAEAELLDPQHRVFLELCWLALEDAAVTGLGEELVSVYAAAAPSRYRPAPVERDDLRGRYQQMIATGPDYLATRVSHLLDLRGEAVNVQTACSSSLVAVHLAGQSLRTGGSDVALAGGVSIDPDQHEGYVHQEGMITSPDGRCLPFDAEARGAVPSNGAAVVVLQRLGDALARGRRVHAVIRGTAINNDGRDKSSFMAPTARGQTEVIASALTLADVDAGSIGYLETHGTGTQLGDPIEFAAASRALRLFTERRGFCAVGSLKANFGHLDRVAGIAALIKTVHVVREGVIPPLLGFRTPNPEIALEDSPFRVPVEPDRSWPTDGPRRAGVSSFGVGGTNAHAVVEEYRPAGEGGTARPSQMGAFALPLSAHGAGAVARLGAGLADHLERSGASLAGIAHTLAAGRREFESRAVVVAADGPDAVRQLRTPPRAVSAPPAPGRVAFLFPGQGAEVAYTPEALLSRFSVYRNEIAAFSDAHGMSMPELLDGVSGRRPEYREGWAYQPALVAVQVALARLAEHLGVEPSALCGNSIGEYAAAYLAGVFERDDLMRVLAVRDRLMREAPEGRLLLALSTAERVRELLAPGVDLAGENAVDRVLLAGRPEDITRQREALARHGVQSRMLPGRIGPHSALMDEAATALREALASVCLRPAERPVVSSLTGDWVRPEQLADPEHWVRHLREPILLWAALEALVGSGSGHTRLVEASPGGALTRLAARVLDGAGQAVILGGGPESDALATVLGGLGTLWCHGTPVRWDLANGTEGVPFEALPPYPFRRKRFWNHTPEAPAPAVEGVPAGRALNAPVWRPAPLSDPRPGDLPPRVVVCGGGDLGAALAERMTALGVTVDRAEADDGHEPGAAVVDLTLTTVDIPDDLEPWAERGLLGPAERVGRWQPRRYLAVTRGLCPVLPADRPDPRLSAVLGLVRCAPHDWPGLTAGLVDFESTADRVAEVEVLVAELATAEDRDVTYRDGVRYLRHYQPVVPSGPTLLRDNGVYLLVGGTGRLGPVVADAISAEVRATIVIAGRNPGRSRPAHEQALLEAARRRGCTVVKHEVDAADPDALTAALDELTLRHERIDGVFHLAANTSVAEFPLLSDMDTETAIAVAHAKVSTARNLAAAVHGRDYDFVVLFSSISTVIGALRFGPYVSANAYLDALAAQLRATGRPWISAVWDGWTDTGEATEDGLGSADGAHLLRQVLRCDLPVVAPVVRDVERRRTQVLADLAAVAEAGRADTAPSERSDAARAVLDTIADVTGHTIADHERSLAGLGIDSLQMMQIAARLRPLLGNAVSLGAILAARSVSDILALIPQEAAGGTPEPAVTAPPGVLSSIQQRLWYLVQLEPDAANYNVPFGWHLPPTVDLTQAREAVRAVLLRHEVLRSAYRTGADGTPRRQTLPVDDVLVEQVALDAADPEVAFARAARERVDQVFDLGRGSVSVLLGHVDGASVRVLCVCHHIAIDAWSVRIIHDDLRAALGGTLDERALPPAGYQDFVRWEHEVRASADYPRHLDYWRSRVSGTRPTVPPTDAGAEAAAPGGVGLLRWLIERDVVARLREVLQAEGVTLYTAGLTGLALALGRWSGDRDVVIGTNLANRPGAKFEDVVGMFVDPVVLRLTPTEGPDGAPAATVGEALAGVRTRFADALAHSDVPYLDVVQHTASGRRDNSLFSVIATMFDLGQDAEQLPAVAAPAPATSKFPLAVEFLPRPDGLAVHVLYAIDRYLPSTVERALGRIAAFLEALARGGPATPINEFVSGSRPCQERFARFRELLAADPS